MATQPGSTPSTPTSESAAGIGRLPPQALDAEMSLLGSLLLNREAFHDVLPIIHRNEASRFYHPDHKTIYEVLVDMYDRNDPVDLVTLRNELARRELLEQVGGVDYLVQLANSVPSHLHAEHYARLVRDKAVLRDLIVAAGEVIDRAYNHHEDAKEILDRAEQALFEVTDQRISDHAEPISKSLEEIFHLIESRDGQYITGVPTGFLQLDDMLSGMQPGEMIIVAARPSMGKTAFALNIAEHVSIVERKPAAFFSMEMSRQSVVQRILCSRGSIDSHKLRRGMLSNEEIQHLQAICDELADARLYVDDTPGMSVLELRAKARRLKMQHDIQAVFVDYIQLMHAPGRTESRQQEVSEISRGLKALARDLRIPIVVLAQLNRNPEGRSDGKPRMSDLRESGALEQDADVVILLHREEYYKKENCPEHLKGKAEIIVDKQRNGPTGVVELQFNHRSTRFGNLSMSQEPAYVPSQVPAYEEAAPF